MTRIEQCANTVDGLRPMYDKVICTASVILNGFWTLLVFRDRLQMKSSADMVIMDIA